MIKKTLILMLIAGSLLFGYTVDRNKEDIDDGNFIVIWQIGDMLYPRVLGSGAINNFNIDPQNHKKPYLMKFLKEMYYCPVDSVEVVMKFSPESRGNMESYKKALDTLKQLEESMIDEKDIQVKTTKVMLPHLIKFQNQTVQATKDIMNEVGCAKVTKIDDFFNGENTLRIPRDFDTDTEPKKVQFSRYW